MLWRRLVLLGTPLALAVLEGFHPQPADVAEAIEEGPWLFWFHMLQLLLMGLITLAVYLLTDGLQGSPVSVSRWAIGVFAVFYSAYDAAAGIATGFVLRAARDLSTEGQIAVFDAAIDMPGVPGGDDAAVVR